VRSLSSVGAVVLLSGVSFALTNSAGTAMVLGWSCALGVLAALFMRGVDEYLQEEYSGAGSLVIAGSVSVIAWALRAVIGSVHDPWTDPLGVVLATGLAWGADTVLRPGKSRSCFICKNPIEGGASLTCPRCRQTICARPECWIGRHARCHRCDTQDVVLFPVSDERWWRARLGPRVTTGACTSCFKEAHERDLRACGQCSWPMCKRCWDYHNGRCARCEWVMPRLPEALGAVSVDRPAQPSKRAAGAARRHH